MPQHTQILKRLSYTITPKSPFLRYMATLPSDYISGYEKAKKIVWLLYNGLPVWYLTEMLTEARSGTGVRGCSILTGPTGTLFFPPVDIPVTETLVYLLLELPVFSKVTITAALPQSSGYYSKQHVYLRLTMI